MRIPFGLPPLIEFHGVDGLFYSYNGVAIGLETLYQRYNVFHVLIWHHFFGAEGDFAKLWGRRDGADAAKVDLVYAKGIGRAEGAAYVVGAADVVQHQHHSALRTGVDVFIGR